jgi:hypothetical protein
MLLSDNVNDDDSIYVGTGADKYHAELIEGGTQCTEDVTSGDYCCNEVDATDYCFHWKGQDEVRKGQSSTHIHRRWQNILTKFLARHEHHHTL